ncbi:MAG TPA: heme-binding protein [Rhizomicrobium sp.]|nr:heme-binding protein [Rhizomicrobium sp.]
MKKMLLAATAMLIAAPAVAQAPAANPAPTIAPAPSPDEMKLPRPARARGIPTALAIEAAQAANANCLSTTYKTTTLVADSAGVPIVVISNDGAAAITQRIAMTKAQAVLKYKMSSGEVLAKAGTDTALAAAIKADPMIETARPGAFPLKAGSETVGIISVSGAPGGEKDEVCAKAGIAAIQSRIQ